MKGISIAALLATSLTFLSGVSSAQVAVDAAEISCADSDVPGYIPAAGIDKRQSSNSQYWVTGPATNVIGRRYPVHQFAGDPALKDFFNAFVVGLDSVMKNEATSSPGSYFQIAGIHGMPYRAWNNEFGSANPSNPPRNGYCAHSSLLFLTLHRPYLSLLEQRVVANCKTVFGRVRNPSERARFLATCDRARLPYWDWGLSATPTVPQIMMTQTVQVVTVENGRTVQKTIDNPLFSYRFKQGENSQLGYNPYLQWQTTRRFVMRNSNSGQYTSTTASGIQELRAGFADRRRKMCAVLTATNSNFGSICTRAFRSGQSPAAFVSMEAIHDSIHNAVGVQYGTMSDLGVSAFDPIFWTHHCNIDRMFAMWQAMYPQKSVMGSLETNSKTFGRPNPQSNGKFFENDNTPLWPFRNGNGQPWTSRPLMSVQSIFNLKYDYPEVRQQNRGNPAALRADALSSTRSKYCPQSNQKRDADTPALGNSYREYTLHAQWNNVDVGKQPISFIFFIGEQTVTDAYSIQNDPNVITVISTSNGGNTAEVGDATIMTEHIMKQIGTLDVLKVVAYLKLSLHWAVRKGGMIVDSCAIPTLKVGVSSAMATINADGSKTYGEWQTHYEITQDKKKGYVLADDAQIGATIANDVVADIPMEDLQAKVEQLLPNIKIPKLNVSIFDDLSGIGFGKKGFKDRFKHKHDKHKHDKHKHDKHKHDKHEHEHGHKHGPGKSHH